MGQKTCVGGQPGHAQRPQKRLGGPLPRVDLFQAPAFGSERLAPAAIGTNQVSDLKLGMAAGCHDPADGAPFQGLAHAKARNVAVLARHAPAHIGIDGEPQIADQQFAGAGRRQFDLGNFKVRGGGQALGQALQTDFAAFQGNQFRSSTPSRGKVRPRLFQNAATCWTTASPFWFSWAPKSGLGASLKGSGSMFVPKPE